MRMKSTAKPSTQDQKLIELCLQGNRPAQYRLYRRYADSLLNTAYRIVGNEEDAKDVLQDAFIKAFRSLANFNRKSSLSTWLHRIVINTAINHLKKQKSLYFEALDDRIHGEPVVESDRDWQEVALDVAKVKTALQSLPAGYRAVLSLYLIEGYDHKEIAQILNISVSTSLTQFARGKKKLIQQIKAVDTTPCNKRER